MIGHLRGRLVRKAPPALIVDVNGVGYELEAPMSTFYRLPELGAEVELHTHLVVREDAHLLYGFATEDERELFLALISVSGVGPKVAMAVLSGGSTGELLRALASGDAKRFQAVPGIGKRTAERIIVELREKIAGELDEGVAPVAGEGGAREEAREGLIGLGYTPLEAERLLGSASGESAEELVAAALRNARAAA